MWLKIVDADEPLSYIALTVAVISVVMAVILAVPPDPPPRKPAIVFPNELAG